MRIIEGVIKSIVLVLFCMVLNNCTSKSENQSPTMVDLIYPSDNQLCIDNSITFDWSDSIDPENDDIEYNIIVSKDRDFMNVVESRTVVSSQVLLTLEKATAYYWKVSSIDINNNQDTSSSVFAFYTKGDAIQNYVPFTSQLLFPENNVTVSGNSVELIWTGNDVDSDDILTYELYFGETEEVSLIDDSLSETNYNISIESGKTYFWKVNVKDQEGAKSIGQVWSFMVN